MTKENSEKSDSSKSLSSSGSSSKESEKQKKKKEKKSKTEDEEGGRISQKTENVNNENNETKKDQKTQTRTRKQEKEEIKQIMNNIESKEGDEWYLISAEWWCSWKSYVSYDEQSTEDDEEMNATKPGPIDNSSILKDDQITLQSSLLEEVNYVLVPARAWNLLHSWYNYVQEGIIKRKMTAVGVMRKLQVEIYPLELEIVKEETSYEFTITISKEAKINQLKEEICSRLWLPPGSTRIYLETGRTDFRLLTYVPPPPPSPSDQQANKNTKNNKGKEKESPSSSSSSIEEEEKKEQKRKKKEAKKKKKMEEMTLEDARIMSGQRIFVESIRSDGTWAGPPKSQKPYNQLFFNNFKFRGEFTSIFDRSSNMMDHSEMLVADSTDPSIQFGVVGLVNLGNTCFMNSTLQCLNSIPLLAEFFTSDEYLQDINRVNPLGMEGKLAEQFAPLIKRMWSGEVAYTVPKDFKWIISKFAPQFSGYRQHDSHELLAFVLDGLHEDLNRCIEKPYVENVEYTGLESDHELASETWNRHLLRNRSIIVDLFQGQLKSKLVCPVCTKVSIAFDPFMYLSIPLPIGGSRNFKFTFFRRECVLPTTYCIEIDKYSDFRTLKLEISRVSGVPFGSLLIAEVVNCRIFNYLKFDTKNVSSVQPNDEIFAYEILDVKKWEQIEKEELAKKTKKDNKENNTENNDEEEVDRATIIGGRIPDGYVLCQFITRLIVKKNARYSIVHIGFPFMLCFSKTISYPKLLKLVWERLQCYSSEKKPSAKSTNNSSEDSKSGGGGGGGATNDYFDVHNVEAVSPKSKSEEKFPFSLRFCSQNGLGCFNCDSMSDCKGCALEDIKTEKLVTGKVIAIDLYQRRFFEKFAEDESVSQAKEYEDKPIHLDDCISLFLQEEILAKEEAWYCPECREFQCASKKFDIWRLPKVLIIHLKRFHQLPNSPIRQKIEKMVTYSIDNLDLRSIERCGDSEDPAIYDLVAVSNHHGGLGGGHYTAYGKNKLDCKWYNFNDKLCKEVPEYEVENKDAYVLFYVKKSLLAPYFQNDDFQIRNSKENIPRDVHHFNGDDDAGNNNNKEDNENHIIIVEKKVDEF